MIKLCKKNVNSQEKHCVKTIKSDAESIYLKLQDMGVVKQTTNIPWPYSIKDAITFIKYARQQFTENEELNFEIALKKSNEVIRVIDPGDVDFKNANVEIGYWLGKKFWGKGIATEVIHLNT